MHRFDITPKLLTGNVEIDSQHRMLLLAANLILYSRKLASDRKEFRHSVSVLFSGLECSFAHQERAMLQLGYDRRLAHSAFHDYMRAKAHEIDGRLALQETIEESRSAIFFLLEDWIVYHVQDADQQLAHYIDGQANSGRLYNPLRMKLSVAE